MKNDVYPCEYVCVLRERKIRKRLFGRKKTKLRDICKFRESIGRVIIGDRMRKGFYLDFYDKQFDGGPPPKSRGKDYIVCIYTLLMPFNVLINPENSWLFKDTLLRDIRNNTPVVE